MLAATSSVSTLSNMKKYIANQNSAREKLLLVHFYFVHKKRVYPKQYIFITDITLSEKIVSGTTLEYAATVERKIRWQKIIVVRTEQIDWRPRFNFVTRQKLRLKKLNKREMAVWNEFSKAHLLEYLNKNKEGEHEPTIRCDSYQNKNYEE